MIAQPLLILVRGHNGDLARPLSKLRTTLDNKDLQRPNTIRQENLK